MVYSETYYLQKSFISAPFDSFFFSVPHAEKHSIHAKLTINNNFFLMKVLSFSLVIKLFSPLLLPIAFICNTIGTYKILVFVILLPYSYKSSIFQVPSPLNTITMLLYSIAVTFPFTINFESSIFTSEQVFILSVI